MGTRQRRCMSYYMNIKYSGTQLIRPPLGHENVIGLTGWSYVMILSLCKLYHANYNLIQVNN